MAGVLFRSEVLFYVQNNVASVPRDVLITTLCGFYNDEEILKAKNDRFAVASTCDDVSSNLLPRIRTRRGDGRQRADASDLMELWEILDINKAALPLFVAADQNRIPPITLSDTDMCTMAASMLEVKMQLKEMAASQRCLVDTVHKFQSEWQKTTSTVAMQEFPPLPSVNLAPNYAATTAMSVKTQPIASTSVINADEVNGCAVNAVAEDYKASSSAKYLLRGNRQAVSVPGRDVKTVPRRLVAFAGRLHIDTTEDQLKEFLKDAGLVDLKCRKLENKDNRFKTAAFMVSCDRSCYDLFYSEATWPDGCELRDWYFHNTSSMRSHPS